MFYFLFNNETDVATIKQFGIVVGKEFIQINSHILSPPKLQYQQRILEITKPGEWRADREKFLIPHKPRPKWGILVLDRKAGENVDMFGKGIVTAARNLGLNFDNYNPNNNYWLPNHQRIMNSNDFDNILNEFKKDNFELVFVIVPKFGDQYQETKKSAELRCGMLTQCIKAETVLKRLNGSTFSNIMLKVNAKLNGTNHRIADNSNPEIEMSINKRRFMVIGADVTHPSPGQMEIPSVVGVVASDDEYGFRYNSHWRMQANRKKDKKIQEIIEGLDEIVVDQLRAYKTNNKKLPEHILYYRDGVSEGQFSQVKAVELSAIKRACQIMGDPSIEVTLIIVQKRHHTRFFPDPKKRTTDRNNNVTPGTVVDSEIVDPQKWQFFMVSHISMQGVAKPTKYTVIHDDANLTNAELQVFTNNLCHVFARCTRAVSYVTPTYYADLVAYRGRAYIHK